VAGDGNLLKPDITAPGVNVVAQVTNYNGYTARSLSGGRHSCTLFLMRGGRVNVLRHEVLQTCKYMQISRCQTH
jgi:hypothetical protein